LASYEGRSTQTSNSISLTATGNTYTIKLSNCNSGGQASATGIINPVNPGQKDEGSITPAAGTFIVSVYKSSFLTGCGAEAQIYEWLPTQVAENITVGGLRIKTIKQNDLITAGMTTNYDYNISNGQSSGHLYSRPTYVQIIRNDHLAERGLWHECITSAFNADYNYPNGCTVIVPPGGNFPYKKSPNSLRPMETTQGNHVGYNEVKVSQINNGYSVYRYYGSNNWDNIFSDVATRYINFGGPLCSLTIPNYPAAPPEQDFKRGELKYESHFTNDNTLLKDIWYYPQYVINPVTTPAMRAENAPTVSGLPTFYELKTAKKTEIKIEETNYTPGVGNLLSKTEKYFESNYHNQVTRQVNYNSSGDIFETRYKYSSDFMSSSCTSIDNGFQTYLNAVTASTNAFYGPEAFCTNCVLQNYGGYCRYWKSIKRLQSLSQARIAYVATSKNYYNPTMGGSFANCLATAKTNAGVDLKPIYELQSKGIVAPIEVSTWKNGKLLSSNFTKYDYVTNPTGFPYPSKLQTIKLAAPSTTFTPSIVSGNTITKDSRYLDEATVKYDNGNVVEVLGKDGITTAYIWGYNNTLPIVKATGVTYAILKAAYDAVIGNLTTIRTQPTLSNAFISTYFYTVGVGMTSETDPNGKMIYYEYDAFNRLSLIRDQDQNILKKICYNYAGQVEDCPLVNSAIAQWRATGNTRCQPCAADVNYNSGLKEKEEKDINPNSPTYNSPTRWVVDASLGTCPSLADWQQRPDLASCETNTTTGANTGNQIIPTRDVNPCSGSFGQWGSSIIIANSASCPIGPFCNKTCTGPQYKCINNVCVSGTWSVIKATKISKSPLPNGTWECIRAWCFPDGTQSTYTETTTGTTVCSIECF
jgi:YD repeat-containing protein